MKPVIVFPDTSFFSENGLKELKSLGSVYTYKEPPITEQEVISRTKQADIIIPAWAKINPNVIDNSKNLKFIIVPSVGYDWIDVKYAAKKKISTLNCPTANSEAVANHTVALILALTRRLKEANLALEKGEWKQLAYMGSELQNKTIGIIGYGNIGKRVGHIATLLGMKLKYADAGSTEKEVDDIISTSDIISLHLPLTEKTEKIINERRVNLMKNGSYLINTSRGKIIDQKALIHALKEGKLAGAGLDVFEREPSQKEEMKISEEIIELAKMPNVITTPHMAFNTKETLSRLEEEIISNVRSCMAGKPINTVN
ncbi:MAG: hypothetical protein KGH62_01280 [Candidatus Micrarchaeota archaeon]|nr:hypothetical protein [Candidatus Micrarchaeota archaeon]